MAWATLRDTSWWWEPLREPGCCWPAEIPINHDFENYVKVFELIGYVKSMNDDDSLEDGIEKVALFKDIYGWFTHVAHQIENGRWASKLGPDEDIVHKDNQVLKSHENGESVLIMRRKRKIWGLTPENLPNGPKLLFF